MKKQLTEISIIQSSKIVTALYFLMGFIYSFIGLPMMVFGHDHIKIIGLIYFVMPVIMAVFGFIFFVIFTVIYNCLAKWLGGIEFEVEDVKGSARKS